MVTPPERSATSLKVAPRRASTEGGDPGTSRLAGVKALGRRLIKGDVPEWSSRRAPIARHVVINLAGRSPSDRRGQCTPGARQAGTKTQRPDWKGKGTLLPPRLLRYLPDPSPREPLSSSLWSKADPLTLVGRVLFSSR